MNSAIPRGVWSLGHISLCGVGGAGMVSGQTAELGVGGGGGVRLDHGASGRGGACTAQYVMYLGPDPEPFAILWNDSQ